MNPRLAKFVARALQAQRVGFGDLRRLQRDVLPAGFMNREEVEALLGLDRPLERADEGWLVFLAEGVRRFVVERTAGPADPEAAAWLSGVLAGASSRASLVIAREVLRDGLEADEALRGLAKPKPSGRRRAAEEPRPEQMMLGAPGAALGGRPGPWSWRTAQMRLRASWGLPEVPPP
jgi:hypothetical protein